MERFPSFRIPPTVETPAVCIDLPLMEQNIQRMASGLQEKGIAFRPHVKSHKSLVIAQKQLAAGAVGLTTATIGEAEVFVNGGVEDILIAYPLWVTDAKAARLRALLGRARITVGVSSVEGAKKLGSLLGDTTLQVLIEIESGEMRTGVVDPDSAVAVANAAAAAGLTVKGAFTHGGHSYAGADAAQTAANDETRVLLEAAAALRASGYEVETLSAGSTPTALLSSKGVTEERPGTFVFGDRQQVALGAHPAPSVALFVAATVVQVSGQQFVLDAGAKVFTKDLPRTVDGFGALPEYPDSRVDRLYDHHAVVNSASGRVPDIGERIAVIPNHVCPVSNLTDEFVVIDGDGQEIERWSVDARIRNR
jgi:D-serine deaminase-like pyridoxal phosphate-dependent protein